MVSHDAQACATEAEAYRQRIKRRGNEGCDEYGLQRQTNEYKMLLALARVRLVLLLIYLRVQIVIEVL